MYPACNHRFPGPLTPSDSEEVLVLVRWNCRGSGFKQLRTNCFSSSSRRRLWWVRTAWQYLSVQVHEDVALVGSFGSIFVYEGDGAAVPEERRVLGRRSGEGDFAEVGGGDETWSGVLGTRLHAVRVFYLERRAELGGVRLFRWSRGVVITDCLMTVP